jgi:hypothetical protein
MYGSGVSAGGGGGGAGGVSPRATGWGNYRDTQFTSAAPLSIAANTRTLIPNNAGIKDESQLPEDMVTFYNQVTSRIIATNGSDFIITARIRMRPTNENATMVKMELEIGTTGNEIIIETAQRTLPWGIGAESAMNFTFSGYALDTFAATGARLFITSDGPIELYGVSYVIKRTHKGV